MHTRLFHAGSVFSWKAGWFIGKLTLEQKLQWNIKKKPERNVIRNSPGGILKCMGQLKTKPCMKKRKHWTDDYNILEWLEYNLSEKAYSLRLMKCEEIKITLKAHTVFTQYRQYLSHFYLRSSKNWIEWSSWVWSRRSQCTPASVSKQGQSKSLTFESFLLE